MAPKSSQVDFTNNFFFEAFTLHHSIFGPLTLGYFSAFKEISLLPFSQRTQAHSLLHDLFTHSSLVGGDLNSAPGTIARLLAQLHLSAEYGNIPTYLFPAPHLFSPARLPCFDNFLVFDPSLSISSFQSLFPLPVATDRDPRQLMSKLKSPSDHVPVTCHLEGVGDPQVLGTYNVADPVFWSQYYPAASAGFDTSPSGESLRLRRLKRIINRLFSVCDIFCLQEVPTSLIDWLTARIAVASKRLALQAMLHTVKDDQGYRIISPHQPGAISHLALIY